MARSLSQIFRLSDKTIGLNSRTGGNQKMIKSPNHPNQQRVVPGYDEDFVWENDKKIIQPNLAKITGPNAAFNRHNNIHIKNTDLSHPAIPEWTPTKKSVREV